MKVLILCLLIGSIASKNQSQEDFKEVATSRISSGCVDRLPEIPSDCKKLKLTCSKLQSQCNKTLWQVAKPGGKKCLSKLRKSDTEKKIYQFCARSCSMCRVSLKEYQKQLDILKALLDKVQGDLSEEKTIREKSDRTIQGKVNKLNNTVVKRCQQDTDCGQSLICVDEWCVLPEQCRSNEDCGSDACDTVIGHCYQYKLKTYCVGSNIVSSWGTLDAAVSACSSNHECGCISDLRANIYQIYEGTATEPDNLPHPSRAWVKN